MANGAIGIQVLRADNNQPIRGATVTLLRFPLTTAKTNESGYANFDDIPEGMYMMVAFHDSFRPGSLPMLQVVPGQSGSIVIKLYPAKDIYFAIYYKVKDGAFKRAAEYWKTEVKARPVDPASIQIVMREVSTAAEFKAAWQEVYKLAQGPGAAVMEGRVFSHASKGSDEDGLEFKGDSSEDGTISRGELTSLPKLNWLSGGKLILHGCNTGLPGSRGWTPAAVLAKSQGVTTTGQAGYAYFSQQWSSYVEWHASYNVVYLWAYSRGKNALWGDDSRIPGKEFNP